MKPIRIQQAWVGAPAGPWTPTIGLFVITTGGYAALAAAYLRGAVSAPVTVVLGGILIYLGFTVLHDGVHRTGHRNRALNNAMARVCGLLLTVPFPLFRGVHLEHHAHTNDPSRDPDFIVSRRPRWLLPLWCLAVTVDYRRKFYGNRLWRKRGDLVETVAVEILIVAILGACLATGHAIDLLVLWFIPGTLAVLFLAFAFDFLPHHPHSEQTRYYDTRIYPGRLLNWLLLGQNYHLVHHLWTTIPWYRYQRVYRALEGDLRVRECPIGWDRIATAPPPGMGGGDVPPNR
ncbi:MAG: fatty acid desaturase [Myxococcota bacterium]